MASHDIVVIGGSTGSFEVLRQICRDLPPDLAASVFIVLHVGAQGRDMLAGVLEGWGPLPVATAQDNMAIEQGRICVAPSNQHLLLGDGIVRLGRGPRENMARPAVDALFRSAAAAYGPRVIGVVLSGRLNDGSAGLAAIKRCGGLAVVQSPSDAAADDMPLGALQATDVDHKATASELGALLARLVAEPPGPAVPVPADVALEADIALGCKIDSPSLRQIASPTTLTCPSCGGVLSELHDHGTLRFRCQIGHACTAEVLDQQQAEPVREALAVALRALEARATLLERMAEDAQAKGRAISGRDFGERAQEYRRNADTVRQALLRSNL